MFTLDQVVPWGRSYSEYRQMFALSEADLKRSILGCGDGPASFNAEATQLGQRVLSCDPLYRWSAVEIGDRIAVTYDQVMAQTRANADTFVWTDMRSVEHLGQVRTAAMRTFLDDYESGRREGRYIAGALPELPFPDGAFDLGLSSHLLFLYSEQLGEEFHRLALREMCRVAEEVRVFPLLALNCSRSPHVDRCVQDLMSLGHQVTIECVPYEFQRGGNEMLRVQSKLMLSPSEENRCLVPS